jgi:histidine triad (HIT) family protein
MNQTIFTKIIEGHIPCHKIYEDDKTFAFLDIRPRQAGHTLVIPKNPVEFVWDLPEDDYIALMATVKMLALHIRTTMGVPYVAEQVEGVDVPHAHVHLIPFTNAATDLQTPVATDLPTNEQLAAIAQKLAL